MKMIPTTVRPLDASGFAAWDQFAADAADATFFHRAGWKTAIERGMGHKAPFLMAERAGRVVGILPLVFINSPLFGKSLSSSAFCVYGGPLALDGDAHAALDAAAIAWAEKHGAPSLEYRHIARARPGWVCKEGAHATFRRAIDPDPEKNLLAIPRKQRAVVRKALTNGLTVHAGRDADLMHRLFAASVHNLGTPVFPKKWFRTLLDVFGPDCDVLTVEHQGRTVAGVLNFYFRDQVLPYYAGGGTEQRGLGAHDFMYYQLMNQAAERGARLFDFGRSKVDSGAYAFKKNWGFEPEPLHYEYWLKPGASLPDLNPNSPKFAMFVKMWRKLPLPVANLLGPIIARDLG